MRTILRVMLLVAAVALPPFAGHAAEPVMVYKSAT